MADQTELVAEWLAFLDPILAGFESYGVDLDFGDASLDEIEGIAHSELTVPNDVLDPDNGPFVTAFVAYVGETLLRIGGGQWHWEQDADAGRPAVGDPVLTERLTNHRWEWLDEPVQGFPVIHPDPALGLDPLSPLHLLVALADPQQSVSLSTIAAQCRQTAHAYSTTHPDWRPVKPHTTGADLQIDGIPAPPPSAQLDAWLQHQAAEFPRWAAHHPGNWDFSADSIDALAHLVRSQAPSLDDFRSPDNAAFADVASWYLGECFCRAIPAAYWAFRDRRDPGDGIAATFKIYDPHDYGSPYYFLTGIYEEDDPSLPRAIYNRWLRHG